MSGFPDIGEHFGRYHLESELGRGGMGVVYAARDTTLQRSVALKILHPLLAVDDEYRERFAREASTLAKLDSPLIVQLYDYGELDGSLYLVTQLVTQGDLHHWLRTNGPMEVDATLGITYDLCEALDDAHEIGVIHRDVKPSNVFLRTRGGRLSGMLGDFGIATSDDTHLTKTGTVMGSTAYMAPERHRGARADVRADIYSVGCVLWAALTRKAPYTGTDVQIALAHMSQPMPQLDDGRPYQDELNELLSRSLAKKPTDRYATASEMASALKALQARISSGGALTRPPAAKPQPPQPVQPDAPRAYPAPPAARPSGPTPAYPAPPAAGGSGSRPQTSGPYPQREAASWQNPAQPYPGPHSGPQARSGPQYPQHSGAQDVQRSGPQPVPYPGSQSGPYGVQQSGPHAVGGPRPGPGSGPQQMQGPPSGPQPAGSGPHGASGFGGDAPRSGDRPIALVVLLAVLLVAIVVGMIIVIAKLAG